MPRPPLPPTKKQHGQHALTPLHFKAIRLILVGKPYADIAAECDVDVRTLMSWRKKHIEFKEELDRQQEAVIQGVRDQLIAVATEAFTAIRRTLTSNNENLAFGAARFVLERILDANANKNKPAEAAPPQVVFVDASPNALLEEAARRGLGQGKPLRPNSDQPQ